MDALSEYDIYVICIKNKILKRNLAGILPRNYKIKKEDIQNETYYIINNSNSAYSGDHWILIFYAKESTFWFDPFGYNEDFYNFSEIVEYLGRPVQRNVRSIQTLGSNVCGQHCIFVAYYLSLGCSFSTILNHIYVQNSQTNDNLVRKFVKNLKYGISGE